MCLYPLKRSFPLWFPSHVKIALDCEIFLPYYSWGHQCESLFIYWIFKFKKSVFQVPGSLIQCSTWISLKALMIYVLGFSSDVSNSSTSNLYPPESVFLLLLWLWVCMVFLFRSLASCWVLVAGTAFLLFGSTLGKLANFSCQSTRRVCGSGSPQL